MGGLGKPPPAWRGVRNAAVVRWRAPGDGLALAEHVPCSRRWPRSGIGSVRRPWSVLADRRRGRASLERHHRLRSQLATSLCRNRLASRGRGRLADGIGRSVVAGTRRFVGVSALNQGSGNWIVTGCSWPGGAEAVTSPGRLRFGRAETGKQQLPSPRCSRSAPGGPSAAVNEASRISLRRKVPIGCWSQRQQEAAPGACRCRGGRGCADGLKRPVAVQGPRLLVDAAERIGRAEAPSLHSPAGRPWSGGMLGTRKAQLAVVAMQISGGRPRADFRHCRRRRRWEGGNTLHGRGARRHSG